MSEPVNTIRSLEAQPASMRETIQGNLGDRKVQALGAASSLLAGGAGAAFLFGGPISVIIALAAAALVAIVAMVVSLLTPRPQPQDVKQLELPAEQTTADLPVEQTAEVAATETTEAVAEQSSELVVATEARPESSSAVVESDPLVAQPTVVEEKPTETTSTVESETVVAQPKVEEEKTEETTTETVVSKPVVEEAPKQSRLMNAANDALTFVKAHKLAFGLGAAALTAGAGLYYYGAFSAVAANVPCGVKQILPLSNGMYRVISTCAPAAKAAPALTALKSTTPFVKPLSMAGSVLSQVATPMLGAYRNATGC